jgi:hypothetical protein
VMKKEAIKRGEEGGMVKKEAIKRGGGRGH